MINNDLDFEPYRTRLALRSRTQVAEFLQPSAAERLRECLRSEVPWTLAERVEGKARTVAADTYTAMTEVERAALLAKAYERARGEFQFVYDSYMMVRAAKEGRDPGLLLHAILDFLNTDEFLSFARWLTGEPRIGAASAQATRYRCGQFLTRHEDEASDEDRAYAYVINLSQRWDPDWGGLLQFHDDSGSIVETFVPHWNSLSIFRVPQAHSVSLVSPWAGEDRLAITGWFLRAQGSASAASAGGA